MYVHTWYDCLMRKFEHCSVADTICIFTNSTDLLANRLIKLFCLLLFHELTENWVSVFLFFKFINIFGNKTVMWEKMDIV